MDELLTRPIAGLFLALVCAACTPEPEPQPPNLLFITLDTLRADRAGYIGNRDGLTPNLDALAADGAGFHEVIAPMGTTFPSHSSMFTGLPPARHGVRWNADRLADEFETLAELLKRSGYDTAAVVAYRKLLTRGGLHQGFDYLSDVATPPSDWDVRKGDEITRLGLEWLARERQKPFFLWLHYFEAHTPYSMTEHAASRIGNRSVGALADGVSAAWLKSNEKRIVSSDRELGALHAMYDGNVIEADRYLGEVVDAIRAAGLYEETVIVVTADHGQELGEHGGIGHGERIWSEVARVPLVIRVPGAAPRVVKGRVGLVDLMPTLLDLLAIPSPRTLPGRSLRKAIEGSELEERPYFIESRRANKRKGQAPPIGFYEGRFKFARAAGRLVVYDLEADAGEHNPLRGGALSKDLARARATIEAYERNGLGPTSVEASDLSPEVAEELRRLGYLE